MNAFVDAVIEKNKKPLKTKTENGATTFSTSTNKNVDLFFKIGALRGQPESKIISVFNNAFKENSDLAVRIVLWARDVREGAGERQIFRYILRHLEMTDQTLFKRVARKVSELGRWDDLLQTQTTNGQEFAFGLIREALNAGNGLCAKWMPRKGTTAVKLRKFLGYSPKQYRKTLVELTNVVETKMCNKEFGDIEYSHVPSLAMSRYTKAFKKNDTERFNQYLVDVSSGEKKINAGAVYPYDVLKGARNVWDQTEIKRMNTQWDALPNYLGDESILPMIDVSGSMRMHQCAPNLYPMDIATSLGLYLATKNTGKFKDIVMTFTDVPKLYHLTGDTVKKYNQLFENIGYNTNLEAAMRKILEHAIQNNVPQKDMPKYLLILSDMEFDAFGPNETAHKNIKKQYEDAGYEKPILVWWNIQSRNDNSPVKAGKNGSVLVSGFSPSVAKAVLAMDPDQINPLSTMLKVIMNERYNF